MTIIKPENIRKGDIIRREWDKNDAHFTVQGVAHIHCEGTADGWWTATGVRLSSHENGEVLYLIERPKPAPPTEDGTIILADMPLESRPLVLRDGKWWYLNGESFYHPRAVANYPWTLAKVVEV